MDKQTARSLLMDFLYDQISAEDKEDLKNYLNNHPKMLDELKELRKAQKLLRQAPEVETPSPIQMVEPRKRTFGQWWNDAAMILPHSRWGKAGFAAVACLILLLVVGSIVNLQITSGEAGFSLSLGYGNEAERPVIEKQENQNHAALRKKNSVDKVQAENVLTEKEAKQFLTAQEAEILLTKMQQQNRALLASFSEKMNKQDKQQLQKIVKFIQAQRLYDLKRIKQSLNRTQLANTYRWQQTNQVLSKIIQTASVER